VAIRVVKRLMDKRRFLGKQARMENSGKARPTGHRLVIAYTLESKRQKELIRKARVCETRLVFIVTAFNQLLSNDAFVQLLGTEGLASMPKCLWSKLNHKLKEAV